MLAVPQANLATHLAAVPAGSPHPDCSAHLADSDHSPEAPDYAEADFHVLQLGPEPADQVQRNRTVAAPCHPGEEVLALHQVDQLLDSHAAESRIGPSKIHPHNPPDKRKQQSEE